MEHQTALITGAGSGMGRAIAVDLAAAGVRVALVGRDAAKLDETRGLLGTAAERALLCPCDVAERTAVAYRAVLDRARRV